MFGISHQGDIQNTVATFMLWAQTYQGKKQTKITGITTPVGAYGDTALVSQEYWCCVRPETVKDLKCQPQSNKNCLLKLHICECTNTHTHTHTRPLDQRQTGYRETFPKVPLFSRANQCKPHMSTCVSRLRITREELQNYNTELIWELLTHQSYLLEKEDQTVLKWGQILSGEDSGRSLPWYTTM